MVRKYLQIIVFCFCLTASKLFWSRVVKGNVKMRGGRTTSYFLRLSFVSFIKTKTHKQNATFVQWKVKMSKRKFCWFTSIRHLNFFSFYISNPLFGTKTVQYLTLLQWIILIFENIQICKSSFIFPLQCNKITFYNSLISW